jgi:hypothetical protein
MNSAEHEHAKQVKDSEHNEHEEHHDHHIQIVVEVNGRDVHVEFDHDTATGREIRERAGAPPSDDLVRLVHHKPDGGNIGLDDTVTIKAGDHFQTSPSGSVS